jgi:hypothetical protein
MMMVMMMMMMMRRLPPRGGKMRDARARQGPQEASRPISGFPEELSAIASRNRQDEEGVDPKHDGNVGPILDLETLLPASPAAAWRGRAPLRWRPPSWSPGYPWHRRPWCQFCQMRTLPAPPQARRIALELGARCPQRAQQVFHGGQSRSDLHAPRRSQARWPALELHARSWAK